MRLISFVVYIYVPDLLSSFRVGTPTDLEISMGHDSIKTLNALFNTRLPSLNLELYSDICIYDSDA